MEFGIGMEIDNEASISAPAVQAFVGHLAEYIRSRNYGADVEHFTMGLVVIRSRPGYEGWFKQRNPRFQKMQKSTCLINPLSHFVTATVTTSNCLMMKLISLSFQENPPFKYSVKGSFLPSPALKAHQ